MAVSISAAAATAMAQALADFLDGGTIKVYTGGKPATVATAATGTLLATFTLTNPVEASVSGGVVTLDFDPDLPATVAASGTAGYFRMSSSAAAGVLDGTVGTSGADLNFSSIAWTSGGTVDLTTGTITVPLA